MTYFLLKVSIYTFEVKDTEAISGMFYDPTSIRKSALYTLGVTLEPRPKRAFSRPQSLIISVPRPNRISPKSCLKRFMLHTFLSKTHLLDVKTLSTMIAEGRYIGLRIERTTGVVDIFGQWDRHDGRVLPLYDINEGTLRRLTFVYSKPAPRVRIVSDILVCTDAKSPQTTATLSHTWSDLSVVRPCSTQSSSHECC